MLERMMADVDNSLLRCAWHSSSTGYDGGDLNAYLVYKMTYGGQLMEKSVVYSSPTSLVLFNDCRGMEGVVGLGWKFQPKIVAWVSFHADESFFL